MLSSFTIMCRSTSWRWRCGSTGCGAVLGWLIRLLHLQQLHSCVSQHKLALALREYRLLHAGQGRSTLPHNKLIFPPELRYLPIWTLGARSLLWHLKDHSESVAEEASYWMRAYAHP